jgi:hypothetical protein
VLAAPFAAPRPGYAAHDARMREVFCQLDASPTANETRTGGPYVVSEPIAGPAPAPPAGGHGDESEVEPAEGHATRTA